MWFAPRPPQANKSEGRARAPPTLWEMPYSSSGNCSSDFFPCTCVNSTLTGEIPGCQALRRFAANPSDLRFLDAPGPGFHVSPINRTPVLILMLEFFLYPVRRRARVACGPRRLAHADRQAPARGSGLDAGRRRPALRAPGSRRHRSGRLEMGPNSWQALPGEESPFPSGTGANPGAGRGRFTDSR